MLPLLLSAALANPPAALSTSAFADGGPIPKPYTCQGGDRVPPLTWSGLPTGAKSVALIIEDPDAPDPAKPQRVWVHWVLYDLPVDAGIPDGGPLPSGAQAGQNDWKKQTYGGPCPPIGRHRYFHRLFALDVPPGTLKFAAPPTAAELRVAMGGHVLGEATLLGTYQKE